MKEMWKNYFHKLYNENLVRGLGVDDTYLSIDILYCADHGVGRKECITKNENRKVCRT